MPPNARQLEAKWFEVAFPQRDIVERSPKADSRNTRSIGGTRNCAFSRVGAFRIDFRRLAALGGARQRGVDPDRAIERPTPVQNPMATTHDTPYTPAKLSARMAGRSRTHSDIPSFAGPPARLARRASCFLGFVLQQARIAPAVRVGLFVIPVNDWAREEAGNRLVNLQGASAAN